MKEFNTNYSFSPKNNAFYPAALIDSYIAAGSLPDDLISIADSFFSEFTGIPPEGKIRAAGNDGCPVWVDIPEPTHQDLHTAAAQEKLCRINQINDYINSKQWPGKAAIGRLSGTSLEQYNHWLDYLDELEAVDTSSSQTIKWPSAPSEV